MADAAARPRKKPLQPPPTVKPKRLVSAQDIKDEKRHRELADRYEELAEENSDNSQGPKWAAEATKQSRIALGIRARISDAEADEVRMAFMREMKGLR